MWRYCCTNETKDNRLSYRESAFVERIIERIKESKARGGNDNIIFDVFGGATPFAIYVEKIFNEPFTVGPYHYLRGDSLGILVSILEDYFVDLIAKASGAACTIAAGQGDTAYPTICVYHLEMVENDRLPYGVSSWEGIDTLAMFADGWEDEDFEQEELELLSKLTRRFADKAGVVKLTNEAIRRLGFKFFQAIVALTNDARVESDKVERVLVQAQQSQGHLEILYEVLEQKYKDMSHVDLFNSTPPPRMVGDRLMHTIVPRHICQSQVYRQHINARVSLSHVDAAWIPREGSSVEEERREAIAVYVGDDDMSDEESDSSSSHGSAADYDDEDDEEDDDEEDA